MTAIDFLTRTGQTCTDTPHRQEFILLSDVLGVAALVDSLNNPKVGTATESSLLGPFFTEDAPDRASFVLTVRVGVRGLTSPTRTLQSSTASRSRPRGRASTCMSRDTYATPAARLSLARS